MISRDIVRIFRYGGSGPHKISGPGDAFFFFFPLLILHENFLTSSQGIEKGFGAS